MKKQLWAIIMMSVLSANANASLIEGRSGWWAFNGNADDATGNANNGEVYGATLVADRHGNENQAYYFDGLDDYIHIENPTGISSGDSAYSVSLWANLSYDEQPWFNNGHDLYEAFLFSRGAEAPDQAQHITLMNGNVGLTHWANDNTTSYTPSYEEWFNLTTTYDGQYEKLYINGKLEWTSQAFTLNVNNSSGITFGGHVNYPNLIMFNGSLDDISFYNRVLSGEEIQRLSEVTVTVPEPSTLAILALGLIGLARRKA